MFVLRLTPAFQDVAGRQVAAPFHTEVLAEHRQQDSDPSLEPPNAWTPISPTHTPCTAAAWGDTRRLGGCAARSVPEAKLRETRHMLQSCLTHRELTSHDVPSLGIQVSALGYAAPLAGSIKLPREP